MTKGEISAFIDTISPTGPGGVIKIKKVLRELLKQKKEGEIVTVEELEEALLKKQDTLVSGENVKTVGGQSIVGKGNIEVGDKDAIKFVLQQLTEVQKTQARENIDAYKKPSTGIPASDIATGVIPNITGKQDIITDLQEIRSGAAAGATAYQKPSAGIPSSDMTSAVQNSLELAVGSLQKTAQTLTSAEKAQVRNNLGIKEGVSKVVSTLPTTEIDENIVYLVPTANAGEFTEYKYNGSSWENLGTFIVPAPTVVNDLETGGSTSALSAEMGVVLDGKVSQLGQEINGKEVINYKSYTSTGASKHVSLSEINKVSGDTVYFKYDGGLNNLYIYSATSSGLSTPLTIVSDSSTEGHFQILPVSDSITKIFILNDNTRFPIGSTISFVTGEEYIPGINDKIDELQQTDTNLSDEIVSLNEEVFGEYKSYTSTGASKHVSLSEINKVSGDTVYFKYDGGLNNLYIYSATSSGLSTPLTIVSDSSTEGHFQILPVSDSITKIFILNDNTRFPIGSTISFQITDSLAKDIEKLNESIEDINDEIGDISDEIDNKQDTLISGENIKTINNISILGSGNITISGGGGDSHIINAADYGFLPENTASENVANLQAILSGGNRTIYITVPGTYYLNSTLLIDSNTELIFNKGVILKKVDYTGYTGYAQVFRNRGAATRTTDENITIRGLYIDANNSEDVNGLGTPCFGLRAHLGFMCVKGLEIYDYKIINIGNYCYGIQINDAESVIMQGFSISGYKDGVHISSIKDFVIRDGIIQVSDDGIALNAGDWLPSNCIDGPIRNGVIENIKDISGGNTGNFIRLHNGAWTDWQSGMIIQRGDKVVSNGNLYKADCDFNNTTPYRFRSTHQPTYTSYTGAQDFEEVDIEGRAPDQHLRWILVKKNVSYYTADIQDVVLRNLTAQNPRRLCIASGDGTGSVYSRTIYNETDSQSPTLQYSSYPFDKVKFENCDLSKSTEVFNYSTLVRFSVALEYCRNSKHGFSLGNANANLPSKISLSSFDFTKNVDSSDITTGTNIRVIVKDCEQDGAIGNTTSGSMVSNVPISSIPVTPQTGDVIIQSGAIKCYDGANWN